MAGKKRLRDSIETIQSQPQGFRANTPRRRLDSGRASILSYHEAAMQESSRSGSLDHAKAPARLEDTLRALLPAVDALKRKRVDHLWVIGSVARGEAGATSDIDIVVEIDPDADLSLTAFSSLRLDLIDLLGRRVDLAEWRNLRPSVAQAARREAMQLF